MRPRRIECPEELAEGRCDGIPYSRDVYDGSSIHFWMGSKVDDLGLLVAIASRAMTVETFGIITYSDGAPRGFWASEEL